MRRHTLYAIAATPALAGLVAAAVLWDRGVEAPRAQRVAGQTRPAATSTSGELALARRESSDLGAPRGLARADATPAAHDEAGESAAARTARGSREASASAAGPAPGRRGSEARTLADLNRRAATDPTIAAAEVRARIAAEVARIRADLRSQDPKVRIAALRTARDLGSPELASDVAALLGTETQPTARAVATQVLAQGDAVGHEPLFRDLRAKDPSPVVKFNATFGLARAGDEAAQAQLLAMADAARADRKAPPGTAELIAASLDDPAIKGPAVVARLQSVADNPAAPAAARERARAVLKAKGVQPGS